MLEVGQLRVVPVSDGLAKLPPSYFGNVDWERNQALLGPDGTLDMPIGAFLVHTGEQTVMVRGGAFGYEWTDLIRVAVLIGFAVALWRVAVSRMTKRLID